VTPGTPYEVTRWERRRLDRGRVRAQLLTRPRPAPTAAAPPAWCSNDNETIEQSKIEPGSQIHMVLSLRGGAA
jgi:hypothetical protein